MGAADQRFFDTVHDRRNTGAIKYDAQPPTAVEGDVIPMWVADMDFPSPPAVEEALLRRVRHGIYGYSDAGSDYDALVVDWYRRRLNWTVRPEWILKAPGVMPAIAAAIQALSEPGDGVLICQPVYYPFAQIIPANHRRLVVSQLRLTEGRYRIDFADLEAKLQSGVRIFLLCSPHNPVGRVWTRDELLEIGRLCCKCDVILLSDEIHSDFVLSEHPHIPVASLSEELAARTVTCTSPTKTFNLAGLQTANIIVPNGTLRKKMARQGYAAGLGAQNALSLTAAQAAYRDGEPWLEALLDYLRGGYDLLREAFPSDGPVSLIEPDGTYLAWLDCRKLGLPPKALANTLLKKTGVWLHNGATFGAGGEGFVRMNIACPRSVLSEAVARIRRAVSELTDPSGL
ncbi:MAG: pyridoxal phosphate-dependent aminotransferase [Oscillospiraceae bacterium]|nr:pyridoxal phosphate-dependent aminotransferase [Oscillospiraceae bacterium]